jgi:HEAT repeat protein
VAIRSSSARQIDALIADLSSDRPVVRETALARLTVIGARAVVHLTSLAESPDAPAASRVAALRALEAIGDPRSIAAAADALNADDRSIGVAAAGILQRFLTGKRGAEVTDVLTAKALDAAASDAVRLAALVALEELGASALDPLWTALARDGSASVRAHVADARGGQSAEVASEEAGSLMDDPQRLRRELSLHRASAPLPTLLGLVERIRGREETAPAAQREAWTRARGAAHVALARRNSRLGMYDLRESLEKSNAPLPVEFMAALSLIGDATCLESIAAAYAHAPGGDHDWWREHLVDTFRAIVKREKLTARHAVLKKIQKRWPAILNTTSRT